MYQCHSRAGGNPEYKSRILCHCDESASADKEAIYLCIQASVNCFFMYCFQEVVLFSPINKNYCQLEAGKLIFQDLTLSSPGKKNKNTVKHYRCAMLQKHLNRTTSKRVLKEHKKTSVYT